MWWVGGCGTVAQVVIGYSEAAFLLFWVPIPLSVLLRHIKKHIDRYYRNW